MISKNKQALMTPLMSKVVELNRFVWLKRPLVVKDARNTYIQSILSLCRCLYTQAMREIRGKDYLKRAVESVQDIQAESYLVYSLNVGWDMKVVSRIDSMCDEISEHLYKVSASRNAGVCKSKDEAE